MTREEIIRNLKYTMEKHKNDTVNTFGTNISVMCKDILDYLEQEPCECYVFNPLNFDRTTKINSALDMAIDILEKIEKCDETSATKCFTCVNEIKDLINRSNLL